VGAGLANGRTRSRWRIRTASSPRVVILVELDKIENRKIDPPSPRPERTGIQSAHTRIDAVRTAQTARVENAGRRAAISRRHAVQPRLHRAFTEKSSSRANCVMSR